MYCLLAFTFENCNPLQTKLTQLISFAELEKHIPDAHVLISTPFHPAYVIAERIKKAKNLKLLLTAGIGSDHIDLNAAAAAAVTIAEVTGTISEIISLVTALFMLWTFWYEQVSAMILHNLTDAFFNNFYSK